MHSLTALARPCSPLNGPYSLVVVFGARVFTTTAAHHLGADCGASCCGVMTPALMVAAAKRDAARMMARVTPLPPYPTPAQLPAPLSCTPAPPHPDTLSSAALPS